VPYTLLLADDSVTIQRVIELTFADEDVVVVAVSDGDQAIARLEASPPDIVLADIGMPGKNGYEVAQYIRQSPRLAHIPVVLLTGAFEPVDQVRATAAGCDGVLAKPFEPQLVIGRVKELLARTNRPPDAHAAEVPQPFIGPDDEWAPPPAEPPIARPGLEPAAGVALDDYFDRLDAAFSSLSPGAAAPPTPDASPSPDIDWFNATAAEGPTIKPWDLPAPPWDLPDPVEPAEPRDLPLTYTSEPAPSAFPSYVPPAPAEPFPQVARPAPVTPPSALSDFAPDALSAPFAPNARVAPWASAAAPAPPAVLAPLGESAPAAPSGPVAPPRPAELPALADAFAALLASEQGEGLPANAPAWPTTSLPAPVASDALVEDITRRVLDRLSDQVVRETVGEIVSKVAEQLVREEIERIKASIK
jgi:CheY-like chemotaxis protein